MDKERQILWQSLIFTFYFQSQKQQLINSVVPKTSFWNRWNWFSSFQFESISFPINVFFHKVSFSQNQMVKVQFLHWRKMSIQYVGIPALFSTESPVLIAWILINNCSAVCLITYL